MDLFLEELRREVKQTKQKKLVLDSLDSDAQEVIENVSSKEKSQWVKGLLYASDKFMNEQVEIISSYKDDKSEEDPALEVFPKDVQNQLLYLTAKLVNLESLINIEINFCKMIDSLGPAIFKDFLNINTETALIDQVIHGIKKTEPLENLENREKVGKDEKVIAKIEEEEFRKCISFFDELSQDLNKGLKRFSMHIAGIMRPDVVHYVDKFVDLIFELMNDLLYAEYKRRGIFKKDFNGNLSLRKGWKLVAVPVRKKQSKDKGLNMDPDFSHMGEA